MLPTVFLNLPEDKYLLVEALVDQIKELDDVQNVFTNVTSD
jgi:transcriptional/translational regulatory protein YebC/TACO1